MRRRTIAVDILLAAALAAAVLFLSSGVALAGVIALIVLALCLLSFAAEAMIGRRRPRRRL